jgi:phosphohistidine phosphatase
MELYFLRHGAAEKRGDWPGDDASRPLTEDGKTAVRAVARLLAAAGVRPDVVVSSPLVRARQTAEVAVEELGHTASVIEDERLAGGLEARHLASLLADLRRPERVMLVGHEPDFSRVIGELTGGRVVCKKGGIARVDVIDDKELRGDLVWLVPPRLAGG